MILLLFYPAVNFLDFSHYSKLIRRRYLIANLRKKGGSALKTTQIECNNLFKNSKCYLPRFYFQLVYVLFISISLMPLNPAWGFCCLGSLLLLSAVYRFLLVRRFSVQRGKYANVHKLVVQFYNYLPLIYLVSIMLTNVESFVFEHFTRWRKTNDNRVIDGFQKTLQLAIFCGILAEEIIYLFIFKPLRTSTCGKYFFRKPPGDLKKENPLISESVRTNSEFEYHLDGGLFLLQLDQEINKTRVLNNMIREFQAKLRNT
jgi:hypothetical protein